MAVFLSTYLNKIDRKGRVSVPASFRQVLAEQSPTGMASTLVVFRSTSLPALEACSQQHMEALAADLELMDLSDEEREAYELTIFGASQALPIDPEGRIVLPEDLREFVGIDDQIAFVGKSKTFQIWEPGAFNARMTEAREKSRTSGVSLSSISAAARRRALQG
jgi:MraZ protein